MQAGDQDCLLFVEINLSCFGKHNNSSQRLNGMQPNQKLFSINSIFLARIFLVIALIDYNTCLNLNVHCIK